MKIQLLLLLVALAGSVCTFTLASPIPGPADGDSEAYSAAPFPPTTMEALSVVTAAPKAEPTVLPKQNVPMGTATAPRSEDTHATAIMTTEEAETERYVVSRTATPKYLTTVRPVEKTPAPAEVTEKAAAEATEKVATEGTAAVETGTKGVLEEGADGASEGLSSGQVFGIVIGSLVAVVVVIAVVSAVVRRMGKYSP